MEEPELELYGTSSKPTNIRLAGDDVIDDAGDVENVLTGVEVAHWPAQEGVAGLLAGLLTGAAPGRNGT